MVQDNKPPYLGTMEEMRKAFNEAAVAMPCIPVLKFSPVEEAVLKKLNEEYQLQILRFKERELEIIKNSENRGFRGAEAYFSTKR